MNMRKTVDYKAVVESLIDILYVDKDDEGKFYNMTKEWDSGTIETVAEKLNPVFLMAGVGRKVKPLFSLAKSDPVEVYAYVEGGVVQGARSNAPHVSMEIFDVDEKLAKGIDRDDIEAEWDKLAEYYSNIVF